MAKITITIEQDNAAFNDREFETARLLRVLADAIEYHKPAAVIVDYNGNRCGTVVQED